MLWEGEMPEGVPPLVDLSERGAFLGIGRRMCQRVDSFFVLCFPLWTVREEHILTKWVVRLLRVRRCTALQGGRGVCLAYGMTLSGNKTRRLDGIGTELFCARFNGKHDAG